MAKRDHLNVDDVFAQMFGNAQPNTAEADKEPELPDGGEKAVVPPAKKKGGTNVPPKRKAAKKAQAKREEATAPTDPIPGDEKKPSFCGRPLSNSGRVHVSCYLKPEHVLAIDRRVLRSKLAGKKVEKSEIIAAALDEFLRDDIAAIGRGEFD